MSYSMIKRIVVFFIVSFSFISARAPLESYKHYLMVMVHGVGANTQLPNNYELSFGPEYVNGAPRKSSVFDQSADDDRMIDVSAADSNWQGDIGGSLQRRGFWGHTMWYDFYEPWRTPIYDAQDPDKQISLSRYLGDRSISNNPMGGYRPNYKYLIGDYEFKTAAEAVKACNENMDALFRCVENTTVSGFASGGVGALAGGAFSCNNVTNSEKIIFTDPINCIKNIVVDSSSRDYFGQTANSRWLHEFFPNDLPASEKVVYKGHTGSFLDLAKKDWKLWHKLRYGKDADENDVPKKYILIAHSMGGLTTRDYLTSSFYKGDVDKLITLDSPHEGSEIANYVQYWHKSSIDNYAWAKFGSEAFDMALTIPLNLYKLSEACGLSVIKEPFTLSARWLNVLNVLSMLYKPEWLQEISNSAANALSGYHDNALVFGDQFINQGIEVMTLSDVYNQTPDLFLSNFNKRKGVQDLNGNGYDLPYFRIVSTSGVPTPGSENLNPLIHRDITLPYFNIEAILGAFGDILVTSADDLSNDGFMLNFLHRGLAVLFLQSIWNDDGSGFVPGWSAKGKNVSLFSQKNADVARYNISFDYEEVDALEGVAHTIALALTAALVIKIAEVEMPTIPDAVKCAWNILSAMGLSSMISNMLSSGGNSGLPFESLVKQVFNYAGFHGYMVKKVDTQKASDAGNTDKKLLDQMLWEAPSVSFVYNPVNPWDDSKGGYVGMATTAEKVDVSTTSSDGVVPVKWDGENSHHEFEVDLTNNAGESADTEEIRRKKTIYIVGKNADTHLKNVTYSYNQINEAGIEEPVNQSISIDKCEIIGGKLENNEWIVEKDNEGVVSCEMNLPKNLNHKVKIDLNAYEKNGKGALLVDVGREPGRVFVAGNNSLVKAVNTDWNRYITFKNRRYQKKNNVDNPKDEDLDKTIAEMVDYRRTPLLVVNKLPRIFDLEVDDLQPDRMKKIEILFNFGSSKIVYEPQKDPNKFDIIPDGFTNGDYPEGFVDPSKEKYTVTVSIGATSASAEIDNPIDAWGKMHIDMDVLGSVLGKNKGWLQPFLEGRNHLRIYSVNRWGMSRVQDMNIFIPGPPPTVQMVQPMADDAFCGKSKLIFKTNLIYNQASDLEESDIEVSYSDASGNSKKITGFKIDRLSDGCSDFCEAASKIETHTLCKKSTDETKSKSGNEHALCENTLNEEVATLCNASSYDEINEMCIAGSIENCNTLCKTILNNKSNTLYVVSSNEDIDWPSGSVAVNIKVTPRINDAPTSPVNYMFTMNRDCIPPTISFSKDQSVFNPSNVVFTVSDKTEANGENNGIIEDLLIELQKVGSEEVTLLSAEQFTSSGAKVQEIDLNKLSDGKFVHSDGSYILSIRAHDNTIEGNEADKKRKEFWKTYSDALPNTSLPFAKYCDPSTSGKCLTQWAFDSKEIVLDRNPPTITDVSTNPELKDGGVVLTSRDKEFSVTIKAVDALCDKLNYVRADVSMYALDHIGNTKLAFTRSENGTKAGNSSNEYTVKVNFLGDSNENAEMFLPENLGVIPDGLYSMDIAVKDAAKNERKYDLINVRVDRTAPRILNVNVPYNSVSGEDHNISFAVDELEDDELLRKSDDVKTRVFAKCGDKTIQYIDDGFDQASSKYKYKAKIPSNVRGECLVTIFAVDGVGNERKSENKFVVDLLPPEITSPAAGAFVSGRIAIYGSADAPTLNKNSSFKWYELSYVKIDESSGSEDPNGYVSMGISVPDDKKCNNFVNRSCQPVSKYSASNILGYWDTSVLENAEKGDLYRIKLVTSDGETMVSCYRDVTIGAKSDYSPTIVVNTDAKRVDFGSDKEMNICWNVESVDPSSSNLVRLEISRNSTSGGDDYTYLTKTFENPVITQFIGEPQLSADKGAYLWINENDKDDGYSYYHLRLVSGSKKTTFHLALSSLDEEIILLKDGNVVHSFNNKLEVPEMYSRISAEFERVVDARNHEDLILQTKSRKGLRWSIATSYMAEDGNNPVKLFTEASQDKYAYFGKTSTPLFGSASDAEVNIPSVLGGRCFAWNGKVEQKNVNVPSGTYKIKVVLENQENHQTVFGETNVDVIGAPVNITEEAVTPKIVPFSPVINSNVTLSFKIDQDAKVSVFVRKKKCSQENEETDLNEFMKLDLNGESLSLNKQILAGRNVPYVINWNGWYNKTNSIKPYACGYEFVIQAYDMDGKKLLKEKTVEFEVEAKEMLKDPSSDVLLYVDGDNTNTLERDNVKYQVAQGMNDAVLEFSPVGKRILRDEVEVNLKYKGKQHIEKIPFERYSLGVQIHKTKMDYWVVLGAHYTRLREKKGFCNEETKQAIHLSIQDVRFDESNPYKALPISANFSDDRSSDLNGRMAYAYVSALLIPKSNASKKEVLELAKKIDSDVNVTTTIEEDVSEDDENDTEEGDYSLVDEEIETCTDCSTQQDVWNALKKLATMYFDWQTEDIFGRNLSSGYAGDGVPSSGRESEDSYKANFGKSIYANFISDYGMPAKVNSTSLWWHSGCDLGSSIPEGVPCQDESFDLKTFCATTGDLTCGNGVFDYKLIEKTDETTHKKTIVRVGEPSLAVAYNDSKHKPEMNAYAYAWKNTSGADKRWDPSGCLGCTHCRHHLYIHLTFVPSERFWAGVNMPADYGYQNDVNRYLSLDPLNKNFLFGSGAPFEEMHPRFLNKNGKIEFNLKNPSGENDVLAKQSLMTLLHNSTFQKFHLDENDKNVYTGELDDDVEMILHYFKIEPNSRKYYPLKFDVGVSVDEDKKAFTLEPNYRSSAISIGGYKSGKDLKVSISMDEDDKINENHPDYSVSELRDWPLTGAMAEGNCKDMAHCGDDENDVLYVFDTTPLDGTENGSYVSEDGYKHFSRKVKLDRLPGDVNGYDVSLYLQNDGASPVTYYKTQGPNGELVITDNPVISIYEAIAEVAPAYQNDYEIRNSILYKKGAYNGEVYIAEKDPLMSKIDDDGDGLIAEDNRDSENLDDDGDLAIEEDPSDAIRVRVNAQFPFVGGGGKAPEIKYNIRDLILAKTKEHNERNPQNTVAPGASESSGWSVFKPNWTDAEDLLTQWEESNDVSKLKRTGIFYKDGKKNTDIMISEVGSLNDYDATNGYLVLKADKFDGRDRRIIEVRGKMPFNAKTDKYEIYASSETGWINLTPENPRTTTEHTLSGTLAYWDVTTSGFHQLLLIRHVNGDKFYKIFDVAVGNKKTKEAGDALGRTQISTSYEMEFVDVVPLGADEVPQTIPGGGKMGPVVQIYPAVSLYKDALTVRLRYTYDEVNEQGWTENASIYVVGPNESPTRLQAVTWAYYDAQSKSVSKDDVWAYAVIAGVLPKTTSNVEANHSVNMGQSTKLTSSNGEYSVTVKQQDNNAFVITVDGE